MIGSLGGSAREEGLVCILFPGDPGTIGFPAGPLAGGELELFRLQVGH